MVIILCILHACNSNTLPKYNVTSQPSSQATLSSKNQVEKHKTVPSKFKNNDKNYPQFPQAIDIQQWIKKNPKQKVAVFAGGCF